MNYFICLHLLYHVLHTKVFVSGLTNSLLLVKDATEEFDIHAFTASIYVEWFWVERSL